jgi:hypothetical protein
MSKMDLFTYGFPSLVELIGAWAWLASVSTARWQAFPFTVLRSLGVHRNETKSRCQSRALSSFCLRPGGCPIVCVLRSGYGGQGW